MLLSLLATASLSTIWARVLEEEVPTVLCSSIVDDRRLCVRGKEAPEQLQSVIQVTRDFDRATGTRFNPLKSTCATPTRQTEKEVQQTAEQFGMKIVSFEKQVGYPVTYKGNRDRTSQNKRTDEATQTVARIARLPRGSGFEARAQLIEKNAIPRYQFAIECGMPSEQPQGALTVTNNAHPLAHRSKHEIERGCAGGAGQRTQYSSGTGLGVPDPDITENDAQEQRDVDPGTGMGSHAEEKSQTRYRAIGSQHWQSAQEDWVVMGERARGENRRRRKLAHHPVSRGLLESQHCQAAREWRLRQAAEQKSSKRPGES